MSLFKKLKCKKYGHYLDGCVCSLCDKKRNDGHNWDGCVCIKCGAVRDIQHDYHLVTERRCYTGAENNRGSGQYLDECYGADCSQCEVTYQKCSRCGKTISEED